MRGLYEPVPIIDTLCDDIGYVEQMPNGWVRLWLTSQVQEDDDPAAPKLKVVAAKLVTPATPLTIAILKLLAGSEHTAATIWMAARHLLQ